MDREGWLADVASPEFYPYDPMSWGLLDNGRRERIRTAFLTVEKAETLAAKGQQLANVRWLKANLAFFLQLDTVSRKLQPAYQLRNRWLLGQVSGSQLEAESTAAAKDLSEAPLRELFDTYSQRVRSQGERGVLSSLNQRVWLQYRELEKFLETKPGAPALRRQKD